MKHISYLGISMPSASTTPSGLTSSAGGYPAALLERSVSSRYVTGLPQSTDPDPFSGPNVYLAERCMAYYRAGGDDRPYGTEAARYPCPDFLNRIALDVSGKSYPEVEQLVGRFIFDAWRVTVPFLLLRSFCLSQLRNSTDPFSTIQNQTRVRDVVQYLMAASTAGGVLVLSPKTPRPITVVEFPWSPDVPAYDAVFDTPDMLSASDATLQLDWPDLSPDECIEYLRATLRAKKRLKKFKKKTEVEGD